MCNRNFFFNPSTHILPSSCLFVLCVFVFIIYSLTVNTEVLCISGYFVALKDFRKLRYSVFSLPELELRGKRNRSKCLYSGQNAFGIWSHLSSAP